jgi:hypothetical protein
MSGSGDDGNENVSLLPSLAQRTAGGTRSSSVHTLSCPASRVGRYTVTRRRVLLRHTDFATPALHLATQQAIRALVIMGRPQAGATTHCRLWRSSRGLRRDVAPSVPRSLIQFCELPSAAIDARNDLTGVAVVMRETRPLSIRCPGCSHHCRSKRPLGAPGRMSIRMLMSRMHLGHKIDLTYI